MPYQPRFLLGNPILVIEDDMLQALDLAASLREAGALPMGPASSTKDALELLDSTSCEAAILDLRLDDGDGTALAWELYRRHLPFIVHTGYMETRFLPAHWPGCQIMFKPACMDKLIRTLDRLARWKRLGSRVAADARRAPVAIPRHLHLVRSARAG